MMTYLEYLQDKKINKNIEYLHDKKQYIASYPYTKDIFHLLHNREIALKRAHNLEANLLKRPDDIQLLNQSLTDSFERFFLSRYMKFLTGRDKLTTYQ